MDNTHSDDAASRDTSAAGAASPAVAGMNRRQFLGTAAAAGGLLLAPSIARGQQFTDWGWPQPYEQISAKSKAWLQSKGWWPLNAGWIVVWSGQELIGNIMMT